MFLHYQKEQKMNSSTVRPSTVTGLLCDTAAPTGVRYAGCRVEGSFIVLRFVDERTREERDNGLVTTLVLYVDRYLNADGKEVMRESGELEQTIREERKTLWAWVMAGIRKLIS
jgi:hypothetical protein